MTGVCRSAALPRCIRRRMDPIGDDFSILDERRARGASRVPRREQGMTPYEVMLSESQERMLVIPKREHLDDVLALFRKWEIHADVIGIVTDDGVATIGRHADRDASE